MQQLSYTEENYLKALYHLSQGGEDLVNTNSLADSMDTTAASANDMMKRLSQKGLIGHQKYKGASLLSEGKNIALRIIRKHRLWEVFLVQKLNFRWDEVHEIAEQLEHIQSPLLIQKLDEFLGHPSIDPHGDPIPDEHGTMKEVRKISLAESNVGDRGLVVAVSDDNSELLQHLDSIGIELGCVVDVQERVAFDHSLSLKVGGDQVRFISKTIAENLLVTILDT
ncbi:MAG: metal-dependent transcriptional regulator [Bacteroidota bacterium]